MLVAQYVVHLAIANMGGRGGRYTFELFASSWRTFRVILVRSRWGMHGREGPFHTRTRYGSVFDPLTRKCGERCMGISYRKYKVDGYKFSPYNILREKCCCWVLHVPCMCLQCLCIVNIFFACRFWIPCVRNVLVVRWLCVNLALYLRL